MLDTTSALINTRLQVGWEAARRTDRLELLFSACSNRQESPVVRWRVALGETLIRLGQRMTHEHRAAQTLQPSTYTPCR